MENHTIGIRLHDLNQGLVVVSSGLVNRYYRPTRLVGAVAQVSGLLAGLQQTTYQRLLVAVGELGIDESLLDRSLDEMQLLGFARVRQQPSGNHSIDVTVPLVRDRYEDIGERWKQLDPCSIETVSLDLMNELGLLPRYRDELFTKYGIRGSEEGEIIKDILTSASVLGSYVSPSNGEEVLYSPLYWEENPEKVTELADKYDLGDVYEAIEGVRSYQGLPESKVANPILLSVVETGLLPTTTVDSSSGSRRFLFTPVQGLKKLEKDTLTKALALLSAVRYGQHHAQITKLRYSAAELLHIIRDRKRIGPHSEILGEYSPVVNRMVGRVVEGPTGRYTFHFHDTEENMRALDIAVELASIGETLPRPDNLGAASRMLLPPGAFREPARTRLDVRRSVRATRPVMRRIADIISGVSPDVI